MLSVGQQPTKVHDISSLRNTQLPGLLRRNTQAVCCAREKNFFHKFTIFQYGSQLDPSPARYSPSDWIEISISESSPSERSCSIGAPQVSNSSAYEASTGVRNDFFFAPLLNLSEEFTNICPFFDKRNRSRLAMLLVYRRIYPDGDWGRGGASPLLSSWCLL